MENTALREAMEETGIENLYNLNYIGSQETLLVDMYLHPTAKIYAKPNLWGTHWAKVRIGTTVYKERMHEGFTQISYEEGNKYPNPDYQLSD